jgi:hypothetical protein
MMASGDNSSNDKAKGERKKRLLEYITVLVLDLDITYVRYTYNLLWFVTLGP